MGQTEYARALWQDKSMHGMLTENAVMDRDRRLTGYLRGQTDQVQAPEGFELSNGWRVCACIALGMAKANTDVLQVEKRIM